MASIYCLSHCWTRGRGEPPAGPDREGSKDVVSKSKQIGADISFDFHLLSLEPLGLWGIGPLVGRGRVSSRNEMSNSNVRKHAEADVFFEHLVKCQKIKLVS